MSKGFTVRAFSVLAGSPEFPINSEYRRRRSEILLTKSAECIIDANRGWQLDQRTPTVTSYLEIPAMNNGPYMPGLLLRNTESGCKMFIAHFSSDSSFGIKNFNNNSNLRSSSIDARQCGLIISIIPDSSPNEFGDPTTNSFIPDDATRLVGTSGVYSSSNPANNPQNGYGYVYSFGITPTCIFVYASYSNSGKIYDSKSFIYVPIFAVGKILESVFNGENITNALYGIISFRLAATQHESWAYVYCQDIMSMSTLSNFTTIGTGIKNSNYYFNNTIDDISRVDGSWIGNAYNNHYKIMHFAINPNSLGLSQSSGNIAWSAIGIASIVNSNAYPSEIATYGVTPTDGFKGILDTNLFRAIANGTRGDMFDNDNFIVPESNMGLLLGWDSSNINLILRKTIQAKWGDTVKIPSNYVVWSITMNVAYTFAKTKTVDGNNITLVFDGRGEYSDFLASSMIHDSNGYFPALELCKGTSISESSTPKMQIARFTSAISVTQFTVTEARVDGYDENYGDYFIYIKGTSSNSSIKNSVTNQYPARLFLQIDSSGNVNPNAFKLPHSLWSITDGQFEWIGDTEDTTSLAYYYKNDWGTGSAGIVFNINLVDPSLIIDTIELIVCLRWDISYNQWLAKTWPTQSDWWWSGIRSDYDKTLLEVNGVGIVTTNTNKWCGNIGGVRFNPEYDYTVTALYSDLLEHEVVCNIDNFFIFRWVRSDYHDVAVLKNIEIFNTDTMAYKIRITKTGGNRNRVLYLTPFSDSITVSQNTNLWYPLYKLNGDPIEYTEIPLMRSYFSSNSSDEAKTDHPSLDFQFRNNNGFLECKYTNTTEPITLSSIIVSWNRHEAYFNADRSAKYFSSSTQSFLYENGKVLYLDPAFEYIPINYFKPSNNSWIAIPGPYATCECFLRGHGPTGFSSWLKIYHTNTSYDTLLLLQYKKIPATLFTAWLNSDKTPQTISEGMNIALYNNAGDVIPVIGTTIKYERYVVAYYYTDGVRHNNFNGTDVVLATANEENLTIVSNINAKIEKVEYSIQPEFIT